MTVELPAPLGPHATDPEEPSGSADGRGVWPGAILLPPPPRAVAARIRVGPWSGLAMTAATPPPRHSSAGELSADPGDWRLAWADLLGRIDADALPVVKRDASGDVVAADLAIAGRTVAVVVKRPRRTLWYRWAFDALRPSRGRRGFVKTWHLLRRGVPVERPLLLMERRRLGYALDAVAVFERVPGATLAAADLDAMADADRARLFRRCGRLLRRIERLGFTHYDAKATNWIVFADPADGPTPVLLDCDGVRPFRRDGVGLKRLLRAVGSHPQARPADAAALRAGYDFDVG